LCFTTNSSTTATHGSPAQKNLVVSNPGLYVAWASVEFAANATRERTIGILDTLSDEIIALEEISAVNGDTTTIQCQRSVKTGRP